MDTLETTKPIELSSEQVEEIDDILGEYDGPVEILEWNEHKIAVLDAARITTEFLNEIDNRRKENRSVLIVVTGPPGEGKSWFAMRFAQIFDKYFNVLDPIDAPPPGEDPSQIVFERPNFLYLIGNETPLRYGQCIELDEAQYIAGARRWYEDIQKDLMESIESVRSRGFIILIVALHLQLLDVIIRKYVLTYMFHVEDRGRATIYRLYTPRFSTEMHRQRIGIMYLKMPDAEYCSNNKCLRCPYLYTDEDEMCMTERAKYERKKRDFIGRRTEQAKKKSENEGLVVKTYTDQELTDVVHEHEEELVWKKGKPLPESIKMTIEKHLDNYQIGDTKARAIRERYLIQHGPKEELS